MREGNNLTCVCLFTGGCLPWLGVPILVGAGVWVPSLAGGEGIPTLVRGMVPTLAGGTYSGWGCTYLDWGVTYLSWGVPNLAGGTYLGQGVPTSAREYLPQLGRDTYLDGVPPAWVGTPSPPPETEQRSEYLLAFTLEDFLVVLFSLGFLAVMSSDAACVHNVLQFRTVRMNSGNKCVKLNELTFNLFFFWIFSSVNRHTK